MKRRRSSNVSTTGIPGQQRLPDSEAPRFFGTSPEAQARLQRLMLAVSYAVWTSVTLYCVISYNKKYGNDLMRFAYATFAINLTNSGLGLTEIYQEDIMYSLRNLLELLQVVMAVPCLTTEVWLKYKVAQKEIAWMHSAVGLLPTYIYLFQHYTRQDLVDLTVVMNVVSLAGVGFLVSDVFAMAASFLVLVACCFIQHRPDMAHGLATRQCYNYCMALFVYCGYRAVM